MTIGTTGVIEPAAYWRLAVIFDAPGGDRDRLARNLVNADAAIRAAARGAAVRFGIGEHWQNDVAAEGHDFSGWRTNDGAVEVTVGAAQADELPAIAAALRPALAPIIDLASAEIMAGPVYAMVPARLGECVLSLSFRRDPDTTKQEFSRWWYYQHSAVAIPVLGRLLLGYDQVHCDDAMIEAVSSAFGVPAAYYDAYDNLTWASYQAFVESTSDPEGGRRIGEDEIGRIDNSSRRHAIMRVLG